VVARERGILVVTHEVGLASNSAFFTRGEATFREVPVVPGSKLTDAQNKELDRYLEKRFQGRFRMAGIRFWRDMEGVPHWLREKQKDFHQTVAVFTNVVFDTSQVHAHVLFDDMFEWLDNMAAMAAGHPETLFVIRAHPDEDRPGKESRESVGAWFADSPLRRSRNAVLVGADSPISSYDLVRSSKFVLVYNSSIGLEASTLGIPVVCAGRARYTQAGSVFLPGHRQAYSDLLQEFLGAEGIDVPPEFKENARAFLYSELYLVSLDFSDFVEPLEAFPGMVALRPFEPDRLIHSRTLERIRDGFLSDSPFSLPAESTPQTGGTERPAKATEGAGERGKSG